MKKVLIRSGMLKKKYFKLSMKNKKLIHKISEDYGLAEEKILLYALGDEIPEIIGNVQKVEELRREIDSLQRKMFDIEGMWSAIRYKSYALMKDLKALSVSLLGELNQNRTLRRQLKKESKYDDVRKKPNTTYLKYEYLFGQDTTGHDITEKKIINEKAIHT